MLKLGGSTIANRASRFDQKSIDETPGPGTYEFNTNQSPRSVTVDNIKHPRQHTFAYNRKSLPPSIPDPKYAYGFEEDDVGKLIPQHPPDRDDSLGPAFYNASVSVENDSSRFYHGIHFGKYSSKRTDFSGKSGPGPGEYDPNNSVKLEVQHMNMKTLDRRPELQVPRYPDVMLKTVTKESLPGPGRYSIKRDLDPQPSNTEITGIDFERPPFGSQTKRFYSFTSDAPGPASYNDQVVTAFNAILTKPTSFKRTPFNQTAARFISFDYKSASVPGPGQYRIPGFADENLRRAVVEGGKKPPFNVTSMRKLPITRKDDYNTPGPSTYDIKSQPFKSKTEHPSANFISSSAREPLIEDIPGPTAYDVPRAYHALISQHRKSPRSQNARQRHSQFLSAAKRTFAGEISSDTPGPGAYDSFINSHTHGYAPVRAPRFYHDVPKMPGPADYELSPLFEDTVLRGTFNSTLNNPILAKSQSRALREEKAAVMENTSVPSFPIPGDTSGGVVIHS
ncbi:unnamed protein product [Rotaria sordida]|uniref:Sperm-tail PG-rich repeat-containing protein 2 n=1 Tax=Rotaria sordida TaxID=392033 RepID=A0A813RY63_9BILA|nr:unnamed protein product [Rotaria sordida]